MRLARWAAWLAATLVVMGTTARAANYTVPGTHASIQAAVTAAGNTGDTITVTGGPYTEQVFIGAGKNSLTIVGTGVTLNGGFYVGNSTGVTIDGFTIVGGYQSGGHKVGVALIPGVGAIVRNNDISGCNGSQSWGIETTYGSDNVQLLDNVVHDNQSGIYLNPSSGVTVSGNTIKNNNGTGIGLGTDGQVNLTVSGNTFENQTEAIGASGVGANYLVQNNNFVNCTKGVNHYGGQQINAANNWWGSADAGVVATKYSGDVNVLPWLDAPWPSGQPYGPVKNLTTGVFYGSIKAAVDAAAANDVIEVDAVSLVEPTVVITVPLTIQGKGKAATTVDFGNVTRGFDIRSGDVKLQDMKLTGATHAVFVEKSGATLDGLQFTNLAISGSTGRGMEFGVVSVTNLLIDGCDLSNLKTGVRFSTHTKADGVTIQNSTFSDITNEALYVNANDNNEGWVKGLTIKDNSFTTIGGFAIYGEEWRDVQIENNDFDGAWYGVLLFRAYSGAGVDAGNIEVKDNTFANIRGSSVALQINNGTLNSGGLRVLDNTITQDASKLTSNASLIYVGVMSQAGQGPVTVTGNTISLSGAYNGITSKTSYGVVVVGGPGTTVVSGNTVNGGGLADMGVPALPGTAFLVNTKNIAFGEMQPNANLTVTGNTLVGYPQGIMFRDGTGSNQGIPAGATLNIHHNRILATGPKALVYQGNGKALAAENNWWGSQTPVADGLFEGLVAVNPWLVLSLTANPAEQTVAANGSTPMAFVASLQTNSAGQDTSGQGHVPDGIPAAWRTSGGGTITGDATLTGGLGNASLSGSTTAGDGIGTVTVDGVDASAGKLTVPGGVATPDAGHSTAVLDNASISKGNTTTITVTLKDAGGTAIAGSPAGARAVTAHAVTTNRTATSSAGVTGAIGTTGLSITSLGVDPTGNDGKFVITLTGDEVDSYDSLAVEVGGVVLNVTGGPLVVTGAPLAVNLAEGQHWIGLPLTPNTPAAATVYAGASSIQQYHNNVLGSYTGDVAPGFGLWVTAPNGGLNLSVAGTPVPNEPFRVTLPENQTQVDLANPYNEPWTWSSTTVKLYSADGNTFLGLLSNAGGANTVQKYMGQLKVVRGRARISNMTTATVAPYEAFRVFKKAGTAFVLEFQYTGNNPRSAAPAAATLTDWTTTLLAEQAGGGSDVTVGVSATRAAEYEQTLQPSPSPVLLSVVANDGHRLAGEVGAGGASRSWTLESESLVPGDVTLSWPSLQRDLPAGLVLELQDLTTGQTVLLNTRAAYRYSSRGAGDRRQFVLRSRVGNVERATITSLSLQPTRGGGAQLELTVSGAADLTLTVRGLGGRLVKQVRSQAGGAGLVTVSWDGTDSDGRRVPRGSYVVEAVAVSANGATSRAVRTVSVP